MPRLMMGLSEASTYPNSHMTPSHENFFWYLDRYAPMCSLPISSSPSITNFTLQGTSPVSSRNDLTAHTRVTSSPLSSAAPRPNTLPSFTAPENGGSSHSSDRPAGCTS